MADSCGRRVPVLLNSRRRKNAWYTFSQQWLGLGVAMGAILSLSFGTGVAAAQAIARVATLNTIAGNGTAGYSGDSGLAGSAELNGPYGVVIDSADNLYIADPGNNRIRKVAAGTGIITTIAGNGTAGYSGDNGPATSAALNLPAGVALDSAGNLYIADAGNNVIRKVNASGTITTVAGNNAEGYSGDSGLATNATLYAPRGVAVDSTGNLYIADTNNDRIRRVDTAGTITTIAGNGTASYSGDNGPATSATLNQPSAVVESSAGDLYVVDTGNNVIRMVNTTGTISTIAGNGTPGYTGDGGAATSATLNAPAGLNVDSAGNLYIADARNNVVRMLNTTGILTTLAGNGTYGYSGDGGPATSATLNNPQGVAIDSQGNLYVSDQSNNRIREVYTPTGSVVFPTTLVGSTTAVITIPLAVNTAGTTITGITAPVSQGSKQEYTVTTTGCALNIALTAGTMCNVTVAFSPGFSGQRQVPLQVNSSTGTFSFGMTGIGTAPQVALSPGIITTVPGTTRNINSDDMAFGDIAGGVTVDSAGNLYFGTNTGLTGYEVVKFAAGTGAITLVGTYGNNHYGIGVGVAVDSTGNLFVADPNFSQISKVAAGSNLSTIVAGIPGFNNNGGYSGDNGPATSAELNFPYGVVVDSADNLYIADTSNNRIRKVAAVSGIITTVAGNGTAGYSGDKLPATSAELNQPQALAVDGAGDLYIVDTNNNCVRKVAGGTGIITTVAGNGTPGYSGDNGPATSAELNQPGGVAVDSAGDLYVVDTANRVVRIVNTAGIITTVAGNGTAGYTGDGGPATSAELANPVAIAIDSAGNLYISDPSGPSLRQVNTLAGALNYGTTPPGSTSTQAVTVANIGNAPLTFATPASGQNPNIPIGFAQDSSSSCPQLSMGSPPSSLAPGTSCVLAIDFTPATAGSISGTASITDNDLNANLMQTVQLSGTSQAVATTTTVNVTTPFLGQTQISVTILATTGTAVPVGSVVFTVDGVDQPDLPLNSSGVATLPSAVSNQLAAGSHTIAVTYTSSSGGFINSNAIRIFSVSQAPPTVTISPSNTSLTVSSGSSVTDTLTITSLGGYSGTLQFSCTNLPQNASCSFQPSTVTISGSSGAQTVVATIQTAGSTAGLRQKTPLTPGNNPVVPAAVFWGSGLLTIALACRRRKASSRNYHLLAFLALLTGTWVMTACGGGSSSPQSMTPTTPPTTSPSAPVTPAGTSTVQISATDSGNKVQSFTVTLTVQ